MDPPTKGYLVARTPSFGCVHEPAPVTTTCNANEQSNATFDETLCVVKGIPMRQQKR
ncbi:hypothetical protein FGIG_01403 [Fasciola gigantica]|uniref:Uncharacterized protein n=1 Tax=Fasciola gigantica TaxID=46835 RepID=A0A504YQ22_FASGI|nr:hypothetical protein FGIG_01403 [Fasciola gigantica]